jgi:hypothetical protein
LSVSVSPYAAIAELREVGTVGEANDHLKQGFVLIKVIEKTNVDSSTSIVYVLGRPKEGYQPTTSSRTPQKPSSGSWTSPAPAATPEQKALESLKWTRFDKGKEGEWAFRKTATGELLLELRPATQTIAKLESKKGTEVTLGSYSYRVSGDRWLNRFPVKK